MAAHAGTRHSCPVEWSGSSAPIVGHRAFFGRFPIADRQLSRELGGGSPLGMTLWEFLPLAGKGETSFLAADAINF
jgi:hypothetical protein